VTAGRPDPDRLLAAVAREERRAARGKLKIFFGASAGVGKTYSMLEAARAAAARGVDVVVGYVEPHGRHDTERLLEGLERLPTVAVAYRDVVRHEFCLDAALARRATITLVDELAHSNPVGGTPPPRHPKRWQDVEELLESGLDVWTTMNVQHLESLNDVVAGITGVRQTETLPDRVFDEADEVELIDLPPDDLLERLKSGKVYVAEQAAVAVERFFRKPNLLALRELALRRTADRVDAAAREYASGGATALRGRDARDASRPWLARDRFLVAIAPDGQAEGLIRIGKRFADALDAQWTVVTVETPAMLRLDAKSRDARIAALRLADSLGAETVTLDGPSAAAAILEYARVRNATRIVVGEPQRDGWRAWLRPSTATVLVRKRRGIDVSVIARRSAPGSASGDARTAVDAGLGPASVRYGRYGWAAAIPVLCTLVASAMEPLFSDTNQVMIYVLGAAIAGLRLGRGPATLAALLGIAAFNFFFVPPRYTLRVDNAEYLVTFTVMLLVALTIATLTASVRQQTRVAGARERRTAALYAMSRELASARDSASMQAIATRHVAESFSSRVAVLFPGADGRIVAPPGSVDPATYDAADTSVAQWVYDHGRAAGLGTDALPGAPAVYLPLAGSGRPLGVLAVLPQNVRRVLLPEQRHLLETFGGQLALALERAELAAAAESARVGAETESLRNTLLASISHDLRTPLAVITGAGSALADPQLALDAAARTALAESIAARGREMSELVQNVLDLVRLESDRALLRRDWETLDDLVGLALARVGERLADHEVGVALPAELPPLHVDATLVVQLLANLLENAARHTPAGTRIEVRAEVDEGMLAVVVEDDGPGLGPDPDRLFAKFQRGRDESDRPGAGLGLAICRAVAELHGGRIAAANRAGGGARFRFTLPLQEPRT
jgi:two-component system sensor histidine kinase KdpD